MQITRNMLSRIIREEHTKIGKRKRLKENVGLDLGSMFDILQQINHNILQAQQALGETGSDEAFTLLDDTSELLKDLLLSIDDMGHDQEGYGTP